MRNSHDVDEMLLQEVRLNLQPNQWCSILSRGKQGSSWLVCWSTKSYPVTTRSQALGYVLE